jgi:hypothetical protein
MADSSNKGPDPTDRATEAVKDVGEKTREVGQKTREPSFAESLVEAFRHLLSHLSRRRHGGASGR